MIFLALKVKKYAMKPCKLLLMFILVQTCTALDSLPLFMMDSANVMSRHLIIQPNPFAKMSAPFFTEVVHKVVNRTMCVVIFVEDTLCTEDVSLKDTQGSPFLHLRQGLLDKKVQYIPAVSNPYKTLTQEFKLQKQNIFHLSVGVKVKLHDYLKYLYVYFRDSADVTRAQSLRQHDAIMHEVYVTLRHLKAGPIIGFYTGKRNLVMHMPYPIPVKRKKNAPPDPSATIASQRALFRLSGVFTVSTTRRSALNQLPKVARERWSRSSLYTTVAYSEFELQFRFKFGVDSWSLDHVSLLEGEEEVGRLSMKIGAPWNWSYICGEPLSIYNTRDGSTVTISKYQIQPMQPKPSRRQPEDGGGDEGGGGEGGGGEGGGGEGGGGEGGGGKGDDGESGSSESGSGSTSEVSSHCFGATVNCSPYFNSNILSGLFISFICMAIIAYGVIMLFNCSSNDRFDDPNGKEVIIKGEGGN